MQVGSNNEKITIKLINCIALSTRNDKIGQKLLQKQKESKGVQQIRNFGQEVFNLLFRKDAELMKAENEPDIDLLSSILLLFR